MPKPVGKAQKAIMDYLGSHPEACDLTDIARHIRGAHFAEIMSAARALAKKGLIVEMPDTGRGYVYKTP